jgi:hypothetical protein
LHTGARDMDRIEIWFVCMHPTCLTLLQGCNYCAQAFKWRDAVRVCLHDHQSCRSADFCRSSIMQNVTRNIPLISKP